MHHVIRDVTVFRLQPPPNCTKTLNSKTANCLTVCLKCGRGIVQVTVPKDSARIRVIVLQPSKR